MSDTPRFMMPMIAASQAQKHVTHNEALIQLDALASLYILDRDRTTPPGSPADGDTYLVAGSASGDWAGKDGKIAFALDGSWRFFVPFGGLRAYVDDEQVVLIYDGSAWIDLASVLSHQNVPMVGINTTADATNKLAVKSNAILFDAWRTADGGNGDVQMKLSKQASADTASLLYQTNYSGRAEMGLTGDNDFHVKVSPNGSTWYEALVVDKDNGEAAFDPGIKLGGGSDVLDAYEEGTFTPVATCETPGDLSVSYATQFGKYTRIGNLVFFKYALGFTPTYSTAAGLFRAGGLPFTSANDGNAMPALATGVDSDWVWGVSGQTQLTAMVKNNNTFLYFKGTRDQANSVNVFITDLTSGNQTIVRAAGYYPI